MGHRGLFGGGHGCRSIKFTRGVSLLSLEHGRLCGMIAPSGDTTPQDEDLEKSGRELFPHRQTPRADLLTLLEMEVEMDDSKGRGTVQPACSTMGRMVIWAHSTFEQPLSPPKKKHRSGRAR